MSIVAIHAVILAVCHEEDARAFGGMPAQFRSRFFLISPRKP
jgi:hypothetical protein